MKKAVLVAMLALSLGWVAAQPVVEMTGAYTTATLRIRVRFAGLRISVHADAGAGTGNSQSLCSGYTETAWVIIPTGTLSYGVSNVCACDRVHQILWCENTGGLTADLHGYRAYTKDVAGVADDDFSASYTPGTACASGNDRYKFFVKFTGSTGAISEFDATGAVLMSQYSTATNRYQFVDELRAEDPDHLGDGTWTNGAADQRDIHLFIKLPPGVDAHDTQPDVHNIKLVLSASVD